MNFNKYKNNLKKVDVDVNSFKYSKCLKKLTWGKTKSLGRSHGLIVSSHRGGGVKRNFRFLSNYFNESKYGIIRSIEYDPNRSSFIGLIQYNKGEFSYIKISSENYENQVIKNQVFSSNNKIFKNGDILKLKYIPIRRPFHSLEKYPGSGPVYTKSAGSYSFLINKNNSFGKIRLQSKEEKYFNLNCLATLGTCSNKFNRFNKYYKAGTRRLLNWRPIVRGVAMNPVDHPHGGGEGKGKAGRPCVSPWGKLTKGVPTRNKKKKKLL